MADRQWFEVVARIPVVVGRVVDVRKVVVVEERCVGRGDCLFEVGGFLLLLGATAIFAELQTDLDRIWQVPAKEKPSGLWGWLRSRVLSARPVTGPAPCWTIDLCWDCRACFHGT